MESMFAAMAGDKSDSVSQLIMSDEDELDNARNFIALYIIFNNELRCRACWHLVKQCC